MKLRAFFATLLAMWVIPIPVYGAFSAAGWMSPPQSNNLADFLLGVTLIKAGFAGGFVALFPAEGRWLRYAAIWWIMFAALELGQVVTGNNATAFAVAGIISEALYFPVAARATDRFLRPTGT